MVLCSPAHHVSPPSGRTRATRQGDEVASILKLPRYRSPTSSQVPITMTESTDFISKPSSPLLKRNPAAAGRLDPDHLTNDVSVSELKMIALNDHASFKAGR